MAAGTRDRGRVAVERNTQLVAWAVLLAALAAFVLALVGGPYLVLRYVRMATVPVEAEVACKTGSGTCALTPAAGLPRVLRPGESVPAATEGYAVGTDGSTWAFVRLPGGGTVNLEPNTSVRLVRLRRPRFDAGATRPQVTLAVGPSDAARSAEATFATTWEDVDYVVVAGGATVRLGTEAHVRLEVVSTTVHVAGISGESTVESEGASVRLGPSERTRVTSGAPPAAARGGADNLVANGDFDAALDGTWNARLFVPGGGIPGTATTQVVDGHTVARIERRGSGGRPADIVLEQALGERDLKHASSVRVKARLRVLSQSLPLGGMRGTELPAMIKVVGASTTGDQIAWSAGFYAVLPPAGEPPGKYVLAPDILNVEVPLGRWYEFDSGNLLDSDNERGFERMGLPAPRRLLRVEVIASGHDYVSDLDRLEVWVR